MCAASPPRLVSSSKSSRDPLQVEVFSSPTRLAARGAEWAGLCARAIEPNPFYAPFFLVPALEPLGERAPFIAAVVRSAAGPWQGLFPLSRSPRFHHLPVPVLSAWRNEHVPLCVPLVDRAHAEEVWRAFVTWLRCESGVSLLELPRLHTGGPAAQALFDELHRSHTASLRLDCSSRAFLRLAESADAYFLRAQSKEQRRKAHSKRRHLEAQGRVRVERLGPDEDAQVWGARFLALEHKGWKGRSGTALACSPDDRAFFMRVVREAHGAAALEAFALYVGERLVAMKCNLLAGDGAFAWKVAFDEDYAASSPGLLLEEVNIEAAHAAGRWQDSCADSESRLFRDLWDARRTIETVVLPGSRPGAELLLASLPLVRWSAHRAERWWGEARDRWRRPGGGRLGGAPPGG